MSSNDPIDCKVEKFYEGDISSGRSISECLMEKIGANINGLAKAWKLDCKDFTGSGSWTSPEQVFGIFVIAHSMTSTFNLNQFAGQIVSLAGVEGITFIDSASISGSTNYSYSTSGTLTVVCLSC